MKFLLNELNKYVKLDDKSEHEISDIFTALAYEVEDYYPASQIEGVQLKLVEDCVKHPNADSLSFLHTKVDGKLVDVVCGADNIKEGLIVAHAMPGSKVGNVTMGQRKLRGIVSNGMILSIAEIIGIPDDYIEDDSVENIFIFPTGTDLNSDIAKILGLDGNVIELSILPDRQYAHSYFSMAREFAAFTERKYNWKINDVVREGKIKIDLELGSLANAIFVTNVKINKNAKTPFWMKKILYYAGIKPLNNIEDVMKYSMLMTGAITYVIAKTNKLILNDRKLNEIDIFNSTSLLTDDEEVMLVTIASNKRANFVNEKNINLIFGTKAIKGTTTESAMLTSKMVLASGVEAGYILSASETSSKSISETREFIVSDEYVFNYLGETFDLEKVSKKLKLIDIIKKGDKYTIPSYRQDIEFKADIVEEIARFFGVENIIPRPYEITKDIIPENEYKKALINITNELIKYGLSEIKTYQLITNEQAKKFNIWSLDKLIELTDDYTLEFNTLQTSLFSGLLESFKLNHRNGKTDIRLFEIGNVFHNEQAIYTLGILHNEYININEPILATKELVIKSLESIGIKNENLEFRTTKNDLFNPYVSSEIKFNGEIIGLIGEVHPSILRENKFIRLDKIKSKLYYAELKIKSKNNV